jgi:hypothetical protein
MKNKRAMIEEKSTTSNQLLNNILILEYEAEQTLLSFTSLYGQS